MGCWVKFESYATGKQIGINLSGTYVYLETRSSGVIGIRQDGISRADSSATSLNDGNWHHIALSRTGGTLYGFVDGTAAVSASVSSWEIVLVQIHNFGSLVEVELLITSMDK